MNWADVCVILFTLLVGYVGYRRGFIGSLFDVLIITAGPFVALFLLGFISPVLTKASITSSFIHTFIWAILLIGAAALLFLLGRRLEEANEKTFPKPLWRGLGALFGGIEAVLLIYIILLLYSHTAVHPVIAKSFKQSGMVRIVQTLNRPVESIYTGVAHKGLKKELSKFIKKSSFENRKVGKAD